MLWSIDTCQNKVSADQYHVTISRARVGPYRVDRCSGTGDWVAGLRKVRHTHTPERGLIFRALSLARRGCTAILPQQKLLTVDAFRVQVRFANLYFSCIFRCFLSRFNII